MLEPPAQWTMVRLDILKFFLIEEENNQSLAIKHDASFRVFINAYNQTEDISF